MATTTREITAWFDQMKSQGATHMVIVCDTFDYEDYPVPVSTSEDVHEVVEQYTDKNMQRVMEVYDLSRDKNEQINTPGRVFNY